jgi:hypothetical protein
MSAFHITTWCHLCQSHLRFSLFDSRDVCYDIFANTTVIQTHCTITCRVEWKQFDLGFEIWSRQAHKMASWYLSFWMAGRGQESQDMTHLGQMPWLVIST